MKKTNSIIFLFLVVLFFNSCASKTDNVSNVVPTQPSLNQYSITLPFSTDELDTVQLHPIKDILASINYTYSSNNIIDGGVAVLLPKFKDVNLLLIKLDKDNVTLLVLLTLKDNGEGEQFLPIYTLIKKEAPLFKTDNVTIDSVVMKTVINQNYDIVITSNIYSDNTTTPSLTETLTYSIDDTGVFNIKE